MSPARPHVSGVLSFIAALAAACAACAPPPAADVAPRWGMVVHGGAGAFTLETLGDRHSEMRAALVDALAAGHRLLAAGGSSLDAVEAAVAVLEDSPHFNAGKGAVFTHEGTNELDASIMDGRTRQAGAVAGVTRVKNPIRLARLVMERSPHVLLAGAGAEAFARQQGAIELVDEQYFRTDLRWQQLQRAIEREAAEQAAPLRPRSGGPGGETYFGTVGAVALDRQGNLAAATSTGGLTNKRYGRVGDSPIIGAGTYASNESCAVSATGTGEYFIRYAVAHDICARVAYRGDTIQAAADAVVHGVLRPAGGDGGVIGMDARGHVALAFNVSGMSRGYVGQDGQPVVMFTMEDAAALPAQGQ